MNLELAKAEEEIKNCLLELVKVKEEVSDEGQVKKDHVIGSSVNANDEIAVYPTVFVPLIKLQQSHPFFNKFSTETIRLLL